MKFHMHYRLTHPRYLLAVASNYSACADAPGTQLGPRKSQDEVGGARLPRAYSARGQQEGRLDCFSSSSIGIGLAAAWVISSSAGVFNVKNQNQRIFPACNHLAGNVTYAGVVVAS
jgi:hypothetical protein